MAYYNTEFKPLTPRSFKMEVSKRKKRPRYNKSAEPHPEYQLIFILDTVWRT